MTAQNTEGVHGVLPIDPAFIRLQLEVVLDDIGADAIKTGMLHDAAVIETVATVLAERAPDVPLVLDPVMVAKGGAPLIEPEAIDALKTRLLPRAAVLTPNLPEAEILCGRKIGDAAAMREAAQALYALGCAAVLLKGGHLAGNTVHDVLATEPASRNGAARASKPATRTAPAAPSPRRSPPGSRRAWRSSPPSSGPATTSSAPSPRRPASAAGTGPLDHAHPLRAR